MKIEYESLDGLDYLIRYPNDYQKGGKYPVILFLHGAGSRGNNMEQIRENPFLTITDRYTRFPFLTVAPQCSSDTWFDLFESLKDLVSEIVKRTDTDEKRIYLMGASMGGYAAWQLAMSMPDFFAAIVPICGGGMYWNAARLVNVPVWAFHGKRDPVVFVEESEKMVTAVNRCGGNARLTVYPEKEHDSWTDTYQNWEVFEWMLSKENTNTHKLADDHHDSRRYG